jgi:hypothetical protein
MRASAPMLASAIAWLRALRPLSSTNTLKALQVCRTALDIYSHVYLSTHSYLTLQVCLADVSVSSICLLTDGLPDGGPSHILRDLPRLLQVRICASSKLCCHANFNHISCYLSQEHKHRNPVRIHTIAFNCDDSGATDFLRRLAISTQGSFSLFTAGELHF